MPYVCKNNCILDNINKCMTNLRPCLSYKFANRCSVCSDAYKSVWYLKWVDKCKCCGTLLRRKSKHSAGRNTVTLYMKKQS